MNWSSVFAGFVLVVLVASPLQAEPDPRDGTQAGNAAGPAAPDSAALHAMLDEFLAGAGRNDPAVHDRFWADDLIYTGSSGRRVGKADIMRDLRAAPPSQATDPQPVYSAENVRIQQYGTVAVVAFRLVATTPSDEGPVVGRYLNTGTFLKRDGMWRVVAWQATRVPEREDAVPDAGGGQER